jgi:hypothetical protein
VTHEDPNELRPSLSADVLTEDDRPRRAVRDRQQACHPPLSDARRRGRSGGPDRSARHGERPASIPTLLLSQSGQRAGSGVATPGCDEDDVYRVDVSPEDRFHSKGAPHVSRQAGTRDARSVPEAGVIPTCPLGTTRRCRARRRTPNCSPSGSERVRNSSRPAEFCAERDTCATNNEVLARERDTGCPCCSYPAHTPRGLRDAAIGRKPRANGAGERRAVMGGPGLEPGTSCL